MDSPHGGSSGGGSVQHCLKMRGGSTTHWARLWGALRLGETASDIDWSVFDAGGEDARTGTGTGTSSGAWGAAGDQFVSFGVKMSRGVAIPESEIQMICVGVGSTPGLPTKSPISFASDEDGSIHVVYTSGAAFWRAHNGRGEMWTGTDRLKYSWPDITLGVVCNLTTGQGMCYVNDVLITSQQVAATTTKGLVKPPPLVSPTGSDTSSTTPSIAWGPIQNLQNWYPFAAIVGRCGVVWTWWWWCIASMFVCLFFLITCCFVVLLLAGRSKYGA